MVVPYTHESIRLTGRWKQYEDRAVVTAPGAYLEFAFQGDMAVVRFDTLINQEPRLHLWIQVDGGDMVEAPIDKYLRIHTRTVGQHFCRIVYKSSIEQTGRWYAPLSGAIQFLGVQTDKPIALPPDTRPIMEFIGDSITEGVLIDMDYHDGTRAPYHTDQLNRIYQDDSCATWAWLTAEALNYRPLIMGYGAVGVTRAGQGSVPKASESYPLYFDGEPLDDRFPQANVVVINHGANDHSASPERFREGYAALLDLARERSPKAEVFAVSPFAGSQKSVLEALIADYNAAKKCNVHFINASEWISPEPLHPYRDGHKILAAHLAPLMRGILENR